MGNVSVAAAARARAEREKRERVDQMKQVVEELAGCLRELQIAANTRPDLPDVLTAAETAKLLRLNLKTLYSRVREGRIPGRFMENPLRFDKATVLAWKSGRLPEKDVT